MSDARCEREDVIPITVDHYVAIVRCQLAKGHHGRHQFLHRWTDPRDNQGETA